MSWNLERLIGYPDNHIGFTHHILLEDGKALLLDSGGKEYIDSKKEELFEEIKLEYIKNAFDMAQMVGTCDSGNEEQKNLITKGF